MLEVVEETAYYRDGVEVNEVCDGAEVDVVESVVGNSHRADLELQEISAGDLLSCCV